MIKRFKEWFQNKYGTVEMHWKRIFVVLYFPGIVFAIFLKLFHIEISFSFAVLLWITLTLGIPALILGIELTQGNGQIAIFKKTPWYPEINYTIGEEIVLVTTYIPYIMLVYIMFS